jgi:hypothetical protein
MKPVKQEHFAGCAVACVASVRGTSYKKALGYFEKGTQRAKLRGFYRPEIVNALKKSGLDYDFRYLGRIKNPTFPIGTIVYVSKNSRYPMGHYLLRTEYGWMDPWINLPSMDVKSGFRKRLPGIPKYSITPKEKSP